MTIFFGGRGGSFFGTKEGVDFFQTLKGCVNCFMSLWGD